MVLRFIEHGKTMKKPIKILGEVFCSLHPVIGAGIIISLVPVIAFILTFATVKLGFAYLVLGILIGYLLVCWVHFILAILKRFNIKDEDE